MATRAGWTRLRRAVGDVAFDLVGPLLRLSGVARRHHACAASDETSRRRNPSNLPRLTIRRILAWADAYHERTGHWPTSQSGAVEGSGGENWFSIAVALRHGLRGLSGDWTLGRLFYHHRHARNRFNLPPLTIGLVLKWADAHIRRTGKWPKVKSGPISESRGETWRAVDYALTRGDRGLPRGLSLYRFLTKYRGGQE